MIIQHYTPQLPACHRFNEYFFDTWLTGHYPVTMWNHFRSEIPRTNNNCEGYNNRLAERCGKPHLNIYELLLVLKDEHSNKTAHMLQVETQQPSLKRRKKTVDTDQRLHQYGLEYVTCEREMASYLSACGGAVSGTYIA